MPEKPPINPTTLTALTALTREQVRERLAGVDVHTIPDEGRRRAAVAVAITETGFGADIDGMPSFESWNHALALLLTRRSSNLRNHAGQWAMPGGRVDAGESPEQGALREMREEVGLVLDESAVLGHMDDYATRSGYVITPIVVWAGAAAEVEANPAEVASIHRITLTEFMRPDAPILNHVRESPNPVLRMPVGHGWIAAPTAAFIYQFREWCVYQRPTRVAHFDQPVFAWK